MYFIADLLSNVPAGPGSGVPRCPTASVYIAVWCVRKVGKYANSSGARTSSLQCLSAADAMVKGAVGVVTV